MTEIVRTGDTGVGWHAVRVHQGRSGLDSQPDGGAEYRGGSRLPVRVSSTGGGSFLDVDRGAVGARKEVDFWEESHRWEKVVLAPRGMASTKGTKIGQQQNDKGVLRRDQIGWWKRNGRGFGGGVERGVSCRRITRGLKRGGRADRVEEKTVRRWTWTRTWSTKTRRREDPTALWADQLCLCSWEEGDVGYIFFPGIVRCIWKM